MRERDNNAEVYNKSRADLMAKIKALELDRQVNILLNFNEQNKPGKSFL